MAQNRQELKNVVIIGRAGAGKSSLINMLSTGANAHVGYDALGCTDREQIYTCRLASGQQYGVHDTIGLEAPTAALFPAPKANHRLKSYLRLYVKRNELHLLIYCMSGERVHMKQSERKNYKNFKKFVGRVPVALVVTKLDDDLEGWWEGHQRILQKLGMESEEHACINSLPRDPHNATVHDESRKLVEALISRKIFGERDITVPPRDHVTMRHSQSNTDIPGKAASKQSGDQVRSDGKSKVREAGLDDLPSDSNTQAGTSQNADSTCILDADATQPLDDTSNTLPEGFFTPPPTSPAWCSRLALVGQLSSLFLRPYYTARDATLHNMPTPSNSLNWARSRAIFSQYQLRRSQPSIELGRHPTEARVSYARGLARNVRVTRKAKNKHSVPQNIMTINVPAPSQFTNSNAAVQQSGVVQVQQPSLQLCPFTMIPAASTVTSAAQQSGGVAYTQQPLQADNLLTTTSATATPAAPILTTSITGPPFHPDFVIRQPGLWTRFWLFLVCVSAEIADSNH